MFYTRTSIIMIPVLVVIQLLLQGVLGGIPNICPPREDGNQICYSEECLQMADDMLEKMDPMTRPCQNFYQFACGRWLDRQFLNPNRKKVTTFVKDLPWVLIRKMLTEPSHESYYSFVEKAETFYYSCLRFSKKTMETKTLGDYVIEDTPALQLPDCRLNCSKESYNLKLALKAAIQLGVYPLFELRADPSRSTDPEKRRQRSNLYVSKPVLGMPYDHYEFLSRSEVLRDKYAKTIMMSTRGLFSGSDFNEAAEIVDLEVKIALLHIAWHPTNVTANMTLEKLDEMYTGSLDFAGIVTDLASSPEVGITDITPEEFLIVKDPQYLSWICLKFAQLPLRQQANYIYWRVIDSLQHTLIEDYNKLKFFLTDTWENSRQYKYSELDCVKQTSQMFDLVVHRFLYKTLKNDTISTVRNIKKKMSKTFRQIVTALDWVSSISKSRIGWKCITVSKSFSFRRDAMNDSFLESYYKNISVTSFDFLTNVVRARKVAFARDFQNIRITREAEPPSFPHQFVAEFSRQINKLYINPILLHEPFYKNGGYESFNFAGVGIVMAQEMMRTMDTIGIHQKNGEHFNWLTDSEIQTFNERAQCLAEQYTNYFYEPARMNVNGTLTLDSNIADAMGLKLAYQAYKNSVPSPGLKHDVLLPGVHLTPDEMFFVRFAQLRCTKESKQSAISTMSGKQSPDEFRVNGPLRNMQEFATAFRCAADSYMNPPNKCEVW